MRFSAVLYLALAAIPVISAPLQTSSVAPVPTGTMSAYNATATVHPNTPTTNGTMVNTTAIAMELNAALAQLVNAINALEGTNGTQQNTTKVARRAVVAALSDSLDGSNDDHLSLRSQLWSTFADILRAQRQRNQPC